MTEPKKDGRTGLFCRDIGFRLNDSGKPVQPRFYLGRHLDAAKVAVARLEKLWNDVKARFETSEGIGGDRPLWDDATLAMAKAIAKGDDSPVPVAPPKIVPSKVNPALDTELQAVWFAKLRKDFPAVNLTLDDAELIDRIGRLAEGFQKKADRIKPARKSRQTLHDALGAFRTKIEAEYLTPPEKGRERRTSQTGVKHGERIGRLAEHVRNMPLSDLDANQLESVVRYWANRPAKRNGEPMAMVTCEHHIEFWKRFVKWLHKSQEWDWRKPEDFEWDRIRVAIQPQEIAAKARTNQVRTYGKEELRTLWEAANDKQRAYVALALNCGFGITECGTLRKDELQDGFVRRCRRKTGVYGEWKLWPVTLAALAKVKANGSPWVFLTENGKPIIEPTDANNPGQYLPNLWNRLITRVRKDQPNFRKLSFNKLRKTAGNFVRQVADGEIMGVFLSHGEPVKGDELSEVYSDKPFPKVFKAQDAVWESLKDIFAAEAIAHCHTTIGTIKKIQRLHADGLSVQEIARVCECGMTTVRRHIKKASETPT